jgi:hypothetical protein
VGNPGLVGRANPRIEIDDPAQVLDIQMRLAAWFVREEGVDAGTRKSRKHPPKEVMDPIRVVFDMCGLRFDAGEMAKVAEETPHELDADTRELLGGLVKAKPCPKKHKQCADCKQCACTGHTARKDQRSGKYLGKECRKRRYG